jgi:uncharacterized damage-inducible protein DinB
MNPEFAAGLRDFLLQALDSEVAATTKVIAAMPEDKPDYAPDPKSMSALKLAMHVVESEVWFLQSVVNGAFGEFPANDMSTIKTPADVVAWYENARPALAEQVKALTGDHLSKIVDFYGMFQLPVVVYLNFANVHSIHHRGQLSAYLRPMGGKVPSIYGGSADEPMMASA